MEEIIHLKTISKLVSWIQHTCLPFGELLPLYRLGEAVQVMWPYPNSSSAIPKSGLYPHRRWFSCLSLTGKVEVRDLLQFIRLPWWYEHMHATHKEFSMCSSLLAPQGRSHTVEEKGEKIMVHPWFQASSGGLHPRWIWGDYSVFLPTIYHPKSLTVLSLYLVISLKINCSFAKRLYELKF